VLIWHLVNTLIFVMLAFVESFKTCLLQLVPLTLHSPLLGKWDTLKESNNTFLRPISICCDCSK